MRLLLDTAFLINEFFYRHPAYAQARGGPAPPEPLLQAWEQSHLALLALAQWPDGAVYVPEYVLLRFVAVLSELGVPHALVAEEVQSWLQNAALLPVGLALLETTMAAAPQQQATSEEKILAHLVAQHQLQAVLSPAKRSAAHPLAAYFTTPQEVLTSLNT